MKQFSKEDVIKSKNYSINKVLIGKAVSILIKTLLSSIRSQSSSYLTRLNIVIEVEDGKIKNKHAGLAIATNTLFEDDTVIIDGNFDASSSATFKAMVKKS